MYVVPQLCRCDENGSGKLQDMEITNGKEIFRTVEGFERIKGTKSMKFPIT